MTAPHRLFLYPLAVAFSLTLSTGCLFYAGDDDECGDYESYPTDDGLAEPAVGQRNPESGECQYFGGGGGGGGGCNNPCGPCYEGADEAGADQAAQPSWGYCESNCTGLDEATCLETDACRGIYNTDDTYLECWQTDLAGPSDQGGCDGLDAYQCSLDDTCAAVHFSSCDSGGSGESDAPEQIACTVNSFEACIEEPGGIDPGSCDGEVTCDSLEPPCPEGSTPGIADGCYTGFCIPLDQCDDPGPGLCYQEVSCDEEAPACPVETLPGIANGCFTGYCIPMAQCESAPACSNIVAEATCVGRPDCTPLYEGVDCVCDGDVCTCEEWLFDACE